MSRFVRAGIPADATRIAEIYSEGIAGRAATFETRPRAAADVAPWFEAGYPVMVAGDDGVVCAFAMASPYRSRACYDGVREFSVYVAASARGQGYGSMVMEALMAECKARGWWKILSRVFPENVGSRALLKALGFREVGTYHRHAQLDGVWRDVVIVEKLLD